MENPEPFQIGGSEMSQCGAFVEQKLHRTLVVLDAIPLTESDNHTPGKMSAVMCSSGPKECSVPLFGH